MLLSLLLRSTVFQTPQNLNSFSGLSVDLEAYQTCTLSELVWKGYFSKVLLRSEACISATHVSTLAIILHQGNRSGALKDV